MWTRGAGSAVYMVWMIGLSARAGEGVGSAAVLSRAATTTAIRAAAIAAGLRRTAFGVLMGNLSGARAPGVEAFRRCVERECYR
ncbi:hypothetical protein GALLR39Z86_29880 [Glycomyces algeriensis]|uniref:Uncharacterized protein n=1 Tax=Glycomyces algeriensis TaxID=256037 RepID=A0A9W6LH02_9ACTN|nr:hypothetical protein GALLR39Z86_29880 [Glycomyces algeriensis]